MSEKSLLNKKFPDLHKSSEVEKAVDQQVRREDYTKKQANQLRANPENKLATYLERHGRLFDRTRAENKDNSRIDRNVEMLKRAARDRYVIEPENIPEAVYELDQQIARERGEGTLPITPEYKERKNAEIIEGQARSLDTWVDYLTGPDAFYSDWFKYLAFRAVTKMDSGMNKRSRGTTKAFPELNSEALGLVERLISEQNGLSEGDALQTFQNQSGGVTDNSDHKEIKMVEGIAKKAQFEKLYPLALKKINQLRLANLERREVVEGSWQKFDQGSDYKLLEDSLQGYGTGWCTATGSAKGQLEKGDFYVFYSKDAEGKDKIPRIAIRMERGKIAEIRGVNKAQELEPEVYEVMEAQAKTLPGYEEFQKKSADMQRVTDLARKKENGEEFDKEELIFLYEINDPIQGFGQSRDERIDELLEGYKPKQELTRVDYADFLDLRPEEVALLPTEYTLDTQWTTPRIEMDVSEETRDPALLTKLSYSQNHVVQLNVAENRATPSEALHNLLTDSYHIAGVVVEHPNLSAEDQLYAYQHPTLTSKDNVLRNPAVSADVIRLAAAEKNDYFDGLILRRRNFPPDLLPTLLENPRNHSRIAARDGLDSVTQRYLFTHGDSDTLRTLARNRELDSTVREYLFARDETDIDAQLASRIDLSGSEELLLLQRSLGRTIDQIITNPGLSREAVEYLARTEHEYIDQDILTQLLTKKNITITALVDLTRREDLEIAKAAREHPVYRDYARGLTTAR